METELNITHPGIRKLFKEAMEMNTKDEVSGKRRLSGN
jgi:hypothetical protein